MLAAKPRMPMCRYLADTDEKNGTYEEAEKDTMKKQEPTPVLPWVIELYNPTTGTWIEVDRAATKQEAELNASRSEQMSSVKYRARAAAPKPQLE